MTLKVAINYRPTWWIHHQSSVFDHLWERSLSIGRMSQSLSLKACIWQKQIESTMFSGHLGLTVPIRIRHSIETFDTRYGPDPELWLTEHMDCWIASSMHNSVNSLQLLTPPLSTLFWTGLPWDSVETVKSFGRSSVHAQVQWLQEDVSLATLAANHLVMSPSRTGWML